MYTMFCRKLTYPVLLISLLASSCRKEEQSDPLPEDNPKLRLEIPSGFPSLNPSVERNAPTKYGVELGRRLFREKKLSGNNSVSCASCHQQNYAFADSLPQSKGVHQRTGLRNAPPLQNLAFLKRYNWDGNLMALEKQVLIPIVTHEEMNSSISQVIGKLRTDARYPALFRKAFGDEAITSERIYRSIAQYGYTLISANAKYDRVIRYGLENFTSKEAEGYRIFQEKCASCHSGELFTDQSFRNIGFPLNPDVEEAGRARVTGRSEDYMRFRVPSLRNVEYTAPYGSFGQFGTLKEVLDYFDKGVVGSENLDPVWKENGNRLPLSESEKNMLIAFLNTLSDSDFVGE